MKINKHSIMTMPFTTILNQKYGWAFGELADQTIVKHGSFHFVIDSFDELVKVVEMMDAIPPQKTRDLWHDKVKEQLTNIERAKELIADYTSTVVCEYRFLTSPMSDTKLSQGFIGDKDAPMSKQKSA